TVPSVVPTSPSRGLTQVPSAIFPSGHAPCAMTGAAVSNRATPAITVRYALLFACMESSPFIRARQRNQPAFTIDHRHAGARQRQRKFIDHLVRIVALANPDVLDTSIHREVARDLVPRERARRPARLGRQELEGRRAP